MSTLSPTEYLEQMKAKRKLRLKTMVPAVYFLCRGKKAVDMAIAAARPRLMPRYIPQDGDA